MALFNKEEPITEEQRRIALDLRTKAIEIASASEVGFARKYAQVPTETFGPVGVNISTSDTEAPVMILLNTSIKNGSSEITGREQVLIDNLGGITSNFTHPEAPIPIKIEPPSHQDLLALNNELHPLREN